MSADNTMNQTLYPLGIDIGSTTVKIAVLSPQHELLFSDYERHFADIQNTLAKLLDKAYQALGEIQVAPVITGSGGLTLANHLEVPFVQEVIAVSTSLQELAPKTDVAIELGGEDAKIIYFEGGNVEQRMNGICAGGTGSFIDQMASLLQTDATGLNEYAKHYKALYPIAARCGVFAKSDIQPLINDGATRGGSGCFYFPGSGKPDHQRSCLRQAYPGKCSILRRSSAFPFRIKGSLYPYLKAGRGTHHCAGKFSSVCSYRLCPQCKAGRQRRVCNCHERPAAGFH